MLPQLRRLLNKYARTFRIISIFSFTMLVLAYAVLSKTSLLVNGNRVLRVISPPSFTLPRHSYLLSPLVAPSLRLEVVSPLILSQTWPPMVQERLEVPISPRYLHRNLAHEVSGPISFLQGALILDLGDRGPKLSNSK